MLRRSVILLLVLAACAPGDSTTSTSGSSASTSGGAEASAGSTSAVTTGSTTTPTTDGSSDASSEGTDAGTGGSGDGVACTAWYAAQAAAIRPICECEVSHRTFASVDECLAEFTVPPDCACPMLAGDDEALPFMDCYTNVELAMAACLGQLGLCPDGQGLQACVDAEADGLVACGPSPASLCGALTMCGEQGPLGQCG